MWKSLLNAFCRVFYCRCHSDCDLTTGTRVTTPKQNKDNAETRRRTPTTDGETRFEPIDLTAET